MVISSELIMKIGHRKELLKLTFWALASCSELMEEVWVLTVLYAEN